MEIEDSKFDKSIEMVLKLLKELHQMTKAKNRINGETILDNQDVCMLFKLTSRSLQRYRSEGELPFMRIGGKPFYLESDVYRFLRSRKQNNLPESQDPKDDL